MYFVKNQTYMKKYIKYKKKYLEKKNMLGGNNNKIKFGDCYGNAEYDVDIKNLNFYTFRNITPFSFTNVSVKEDKLTGLSKQKLDKQIIYKYENDTKFTFDLIDNLSEEKMNEINEIKRYKSNIDLSDGKYLIKYYYNEKLRCMLTSNIKIYFLVDIILIEKLGFDLLKFYYRDNINNIIVEGDYKLENKGLRLIFNKINNTELEDIDRQILKVDFFIQTKTDYLKIFGNIQENILQQTIKSFDFESFYDKNIKPIKICNNSKLLAKNFSSSILNLLYVKYDFIKTLVNKYPNILENILIQILEGNKSKINANCSNESDRKFLLTNILKKLNTFIEDDIQISVNKINGEEFVKISDLTSESGEHFKVILDTGNSSTTLIGKNFAKALKYPQTKSLRLTSIGVNLNASSTIENKINFKIKFDNKNIDIGKTYEIEAYISDNFDPDTLLIGNYDDSLTKIFSTSYCVGYEYDISKYSMQKRKYKIDIGEFEEKIKEIKNFCLTNNYNNMEQQIIIKNKKLLNDFENELNKLVGSKKFLPSDEKLKLDLFYPDLIQIKNNLKKIKNDNMIIQTYTNLIDNLIKTMDKYIS